MLSVQTERAALGDGRVSTLLEETGLMSSKDSARCRTSSQAGTA
jgi:hypothetical protein